VLGRKRHILTDTLGLLLAVSVHPASIQDRDGAEALLREARRSFPFIERIIGDAGYQGRRLPSPAPARGNCKSCAAATSTASSSCRKDGSSNAPSHGSAVVVGSPAITSVTLARRQRSSASP
jgi:hypothetical protein